MPLLQQSLDMIACHRASALPLVAMTSFFMRFPQDAGRHPQAFYDGSVLKFSVDGLVRREFRKHGPAGVSARTRRRTRRNSPHTRPPEDAPPEDEPPDAQQRHGRDIIFSVLAE